MIENLPSRAAALAAALLLVGCGDRGDPAQPSASGGKQATDVVSGDGGGTARPAAIGAQPSVGGWDLVSSGEGAALVFPALGKPAVRLFCPTGSDRLLVNVPGFRAVGSEERMTFGSGGTVHTLVADTRGDRQRGGVSGSGPVPANLAALIDGPVSVNYGAQDNGPHPAPPPGLAREFVLVCRDGAREPKPSPTPSPSATRVSACLMQDGQRLSNPPLRAIGTEPFWGAKIEGRCVTYSHPDDQQGTRVWTKYTARSGGGGTWTGALGGRPFVLAARPRAGCSDGMSDRRYPLAVDLTVGGEQRQGCAEPR